ncbi:dermatopontin-like [Ruditapes philippinarum]|uniref:dermatopontin-like n=1 Tax=Ruditapes philippinarum TaxID=129788 RepID=UPI00295B37BF|nr:dermatopontin-like [Ruditapes philippinarum]
MYLIWELLIVASILHTGSCTIANSLDRPLRYECRYGNQFIAQITSLHHNREEDRVFDMSCRDFPVDVSGLTPSCTWTENINDWDKPMFYQCSGNRYIGGFISYHSDHYEDRRWKVKCCGMPGIQLSNCHISSWTNSYDGQQFFNAGTGRVTKGMVSTHSNYHEDRIYKFITCQAVRN